jgi:hypothetical protein
MAQIDGLTGRLKVRSPEKNPRERLLPMLGGALAASVFC